MNIRSACAVCLVLAAGGSFAAETDPAKQAAILKGAEHGIIRVQMQLRTDRGEFPTGGWGEGLPHGMGAGDGYGEVINEERPFEAAAFLVTPTLAVMGDPGLPARFIKDVTARFGDDVAPAKIAAWALGRAAVFIELERPLKGATPYEFHPEAAAPYSAVSCGRVDGAWGMALQSFIRGVATSQAQGRFMNVTPECLVVDEQGRAVGVCADDRIPLDDAWKGSPAGWPRLSAAEAAARMDALDKACARSIVRVRLGFRSPPKEQARRMMRDYGEGDDAGSTEADVPALVVAADRVVVFAGLKPGVTARLERITVCAEGGDVPAKFVCSLADYGAFVAAPERPAGVPVTLTADDDIARLRSRLLFVAEVRIQGENRVVNIAPQRFQRFTMGWRRQVYPTLMGREYPQFVFDEGLALAAVPLRRRPKGASDDYRDRGETVTPVAYLRKAFAEPAAFADANNVPLSEESENRLAWLGVELQPLDRALARQQKVSDLTRDGEISAMVSWVYPDSPAAAAGLRLGDILLRVHIEGYPAPVDVRVEEHALGGRPFPWEQLDQLPERLFEVIPRPWPNVLNSLIRALTDAGFGKTFEAEVFRDGKTLTVPFRVVESPAHYDSAPKFKSKPLGLTVRELTYEVRRYFQKSADEPGVIVSNIEPGSKASVAGLKPFEIVTAVNETPVKNVKEFENALGAGDELRLNVLRMTKTRIVKLSLKGGPATAPAPPMPAPDEE